MTDTEKLVSLDTLAKITHSVKEEGKKVVLCHGTYDLLHIGHIKHLQAAKNYGDILVVTVTADQFVNKGPDRPVFNHHLRAENLSALSCVSYVAINYEETSVNVLKQVKPDIYVKGDEYKQEQDDVTGNIALERQTIENYGGEIKYTEEVTYSSSKLLNEYFEVFPASTKQFLSSFKEEYSKEDIFSTLNQLKDLKVAVIGDAIIDEYHYVSELGITGKGNFPAVRYQNEERFAGGSIAVANHIAGFVNQVSLITATGNNEKDKTFIKSKLKSNITEHLFTFTNAPTLTKRRFVDSEMNKYFEVYFSDSDPVDEILEKNIIEWIENELLKFDIVVVPDFGNGLITNGLIKSIVANSNFLAVNTQINSGNRGYHVITRYEKADFISLNEPEIRMAAHDKHSDLSTIATKISNTMSASLTAVTRGTKGADVYDALNNKYIQIPALSTKVVDRIGAGDAFLSLASICYAQSKDSILSIFLGSVAAALGVQIVCNRESVEPVSVKKYITTLLK